MVKMLNIKCIFVKFEIVVPDKGAFYRTKGKLFIQVI